METMLHQHLKRQSLYWLKEKVTDLCANEVKLNVRGKKLKADAMGINLKRKESRIIEVKVSRSDFLRDKVLHAPYGYHEIADFAYLMTPSGLIKPEEIPRGYGLLEIDEFDQITVRKKPVRNLNPIVNPEILIKRTSQAATNAVLFKELSKETKDLTKGAYLRNAKVQLINATCPSCKKRNQYLIEVNQEETPCKARACKKLIPLQRARVHIITSYNETFFKKMKSLME